MNELSELLDRNELYDIFKNFAFMTGLGVSLRDLDGKDAMSYYKNGGACICGMLGANQMCVKNIRYSGQKAAELGEPYIYNMRLRPCYERLGRHAGRSAYRHRSLRPRHALGRGRIRS